MDKAKAVTAAAHKLARLIYSMLTKGRGIHRSRSGLLRRALPAARAAQPQQTGAAVGDGAGADHASGAGGLKNPLCVSHLRGVS
jgi:hypothetical protein